MKKTKYILLVACGIIGTEYYKRVLIDNHGEYFIKINGEARNVTFAKKHFIVD